MKAKAKKRASVAQSWSGYELCAWRDRLGLTQQQAADVLGVSRRSITRWENRLGEPVPGLVGLACRGVEAR